MTFNSFFNLFLEDAKPSVTTLSQASWAKCFPSQSVAGNPLKSFTSGREKEKLGWVREVDTKGAFRLLIMFHFLTWAMVTPVCSFCHYSSGWTIAMGTLSICMSHFSCLKFILKYTFFPFFSASLACFWFDAQDLSHSAKQAFGVLSLSFSVCFCCCLVGVYLVCVGGLFVCLF